MTTIKIPSNKTVSTIDSSSYNVSSSVNGNMDLIQDQIIQKTNDYINIKNAVRILEKFSNWNGYVRLYTEVENNFEVGDIVYVTYLDSDHPFEAFILDNNYNNSTMTWYDDPYDEHVIDFSFGYEILFVNIYNNEVVINRRYSDINKSKLLIDQVLSKVTCRDGDFFGDISDGVAYKNCNFFNGEFGILEGYVTSASGLTNLTYIYCSGLLAECDSSGYYTMNVPSGIHIIKCKVPLGGYISQTVEYEVYSNTRNQLNFELSGGTDSIIISTFDGEQICDGSIINFYSEIVGYGDTATYQWKINDINIGSNNTIFSYNIFNDDDRVSCLIYDEFDLLIYDALGYGSGITSNELSIQINTPTLILGVSPSNIIVEGETATFTVYSICEPNLPYQWRINEYIQSSNDDIFISSTLHDGDIVYCKIGGDSSNHITMTINPTTTTTTTTV